MKAAAVSTVEYWPFSLAFNSPSCWFIFQATALWVLRKTAKTLHAITTRCRPAWTLETTTRTWSWTRRPRRPPCWVTSSTTTACTTRPCTTATTYRLRSPYTQWTQSANEHPQKKPDNQPTKQQTELANNDPCSNRQLWFCAFHREPFSELPE